MSAPFSTRWHKLSGRVRRGKAPEPQFTGKTGHTQKKGVSAK